MKKEKSNYSELEKRLFRNPEYRILKEKAEEIKKRNDYICLNIIFVIGFIICIIELSVLFYIIYFTSSSDIFIFINFIILFSGWGLMIGIDTFRYKKFPELKRMKLIAKEIYLEYKREQIENKKM